MNELRSVDRVGVAVVLVSIFGLGFQQVMVKLALPEIPALTQAALRNGGAALVIAAILVLTDRKAFSRDGTEIPGAWSALFFALEFLALYIALDLTTASRAAIFLYTHVIFTVLFLSVAAPQERMRALQWFGIALSFVGVAVALGFSPATTGAMFAGDLLALAGGMFWAATTTVVKATNLKTAPAFKILLYQLAGSTLALAAAAPLRGEIWPAHVSALSVFSMLYQTLFSVVVCFTIWFWLLARYRAGEVAAFTFLTPVIGVVAGWLVLGEPVAPGFAVAVAMVAGGILLVNWPGRG
jgi:drug/metabolite transporter (DMT)-like permease